MKITRKYEILKSVYDDGETGMNSGDEGIDEYWKLTREGYLRSLVSFGYDWTFRITGTGIAFVEEINELKTEESESEINE